MSIAWCRGDNAVWHTAHWRRLMYGRRRLAYGRWRSWALNVSRLRWRGSVCMWRPNAPVVMMVVTDITG